jgi:hypothetical protein
MSKNVTALIMSKKPATTISSFVLLISMLIACPLSNKKSKAGSGLASTHSEFLLALLGRKI